MKFGGRDCAGVLPAPSLSLLSSIAPLLFFPLTTAGNFLVCLAVYRDPNKALRTPFNFFIVNLAFTDLLVGLVVDPLCAAVHFVEFLTSGLPSVGGDVFHVLYYSTCTASVLSLTAITIDRYFAVNDPFYYRSSWNGKTVVAASVIIWIISSSLAVVYFRIGYIGYSFIFATIVILTLLVLVIGNWLIFRKLRHQLLSSRRLFVGAELQNAKRRASQLEGQVTKGFLLVLMTYALCYAPSCVMVYVMNFCATCSCHFIHWMRDSHFLFVLLNSCLNPFLYAWRLPAFRSAFGVIIRMRRRDRVLQPPLSNPSRKIQQETWVSTSGRVDPALARTAGHCGSTVAPRSLHADDVIPVKDITNNAKSIKVRVIGQSRSTNTFIRDQETSCTLHKCDEVMLNSGCCIETKL